ncbi:PTR2-domain-containing protein [Cylindrobasidium torrendii FP15055 ss-10]|uniref:PTR2-domain-containing protein n=1 Tax=Cylindrobasidium torrendii FP15055 ss-10 TaxID=1314674 RepID=A0A0D7BID4_9AGAR|nr:PTR2-domain-containing protein [Cylindrobasidium torrendii FP15055 ss-10]
MATPEADKSIEKSSTIDEKHSTEDVRHGTHHLPDDIVPGSEGVTFAEMETLRHVSDKLNFTSFLIIVVEFSERWSYYGTSNVLNNYIRAPLPQGSRDGSVPAANRASGIAGALGKGQQTSFSIRTFLNFWFYVTPFIGGIVADCWLGRYNTIMLFSIIYLIGHIILVASATPASLEDTDRALGLLIFSIIVMGIGGGAIKANVSPMIAEQYTGKMRKKTLKSGEVVVVSPQVTYQHIYNWFYASINWGSVGAISASFLARDHGYWSAFLVPTCILAIVPVVLAGGRKYYVVTPPRGSILLEVIRVLALCIGDKISFNPVATWRRLRAPNFWDVARPTSYEAGKAPKKITWDDEFVDEVVRTLKACQVFLAMPFFYLCYSQIDGNLGTVAAGMRLDGTPNDLIQNLNPIVIIIIIPIMDLLVYPALRRVGFNYTPIKRITTGFFFASMAMLYAAILQKFIYEKSPCHDNIPSVCAETGAGPADLNVWIVAGPYILVGLGEIFATLVSNEYAYTKAPKRMKSTVMAFSLFMSALSSAVNFALTSVNVENRFTWLFGSFSIVAAVVGVLFFWYFRDLDKEEMRLNVIGTGDRQGFANEDAAVTVAIHKHGDEKLGGKANV